MPGRERGRFAVGIDYSIACPAVCLHDLSKPVGLDSLKFKFIKKTASKAEQARWEKYSKTSALDVEAHLQRSCFSAVVPPDCVHTYEINAMDILSFFDFKIPEEDVIAIGLEGYAMRAVGNVFDIAEATWELKRTLDSRGFNGRVAVIPPTSVKKNFTGSGNAKKEDMIAEFNRRFDIDLAAELGYPGKSGSPVSDIADSFAVMEAAMEREAACLEKMMSPWSSRNR